MIQEVWWVQTDDSRAYAVLPEVESGSAAVVTADVTWCLWTFIFADVPHDVHGIHELLKWVGVPTRLHDPRKPLSPLTLQQTIF